MSALEALPLAADELEALRLVDLNGLSQQDAARELGVSRQTLGNIVSLARHKVATALVKGMALELDTQVQSDNEKEPSCQ